MATQACQGYRLKMRGPDREIPVSRGTNSRLDDAIDRLNNKTVKKFCYHHSIN